MKKADLVPGRRYLVRTQRQEGVMVLEAKYQKHALLYAEEVRLDPRTGERIPIKRYKQCMYSWIIEEASGAPTSP